MFNTRGSKTLILLNASCFLGLHVYNGVGNRSLLPPVEVTRGSKIEFGLHISCFSFRVYIGLGDVLLQVDYPQLKFTRGSKLCNM